MAEKVLFDYLRKLQDEGNEKVKGLKRHELKQMVRYLMETYPIEDLERKVYGADLRL